MCPSYPGVKVIPCGKNAQWSDRTRYALEQIDSRYVCFLLEDFFISKNVDNDIIANALNLMMENHLSYYKLLSLTKFTGGRYKYFDYLQEITSTYPYGISLMPAIWDRELFCEKVGCESYDPWRFEVDRLKEEQDSCDNEIVGVFDNRNILNITHMVVQGKYLPTSISKMSKMDIRNLSFRRPTMSYLSFAKYCGKMKIGVLMRKYLFLRKIMAPFKKYTVAGRYNK